MGQGTPATETLAAAQAKLDGVLAEVARTGEARGQTGFVAAVLLLMVGLVVWMVVGMKKAGGLAKVAGDAAENKVAYAYAAPAMIGTLILVLFPFSVGVGMGFFRHAWGTYTFVGLENFATILGDTDAAFFRTLGVTVLWTASNVFLHVAIGVVLALILSQARLRFKAVYRVLFIIPWAMPSYITALIWKGMFHPEFGAVNALLGTPGFSWMNQFWSAFLANLITNTWLGFPFMMVTALGGLTAIPKDIYEAAALDGAGPWKRFTSITLPLLRPTLAPAIVLGTVWTFNMFNVIYLVSGGAPGGRTDILITEAFRWAFERGQGGAFGTAAAYSTLIFLMLLAYDTASKRVMNNLKGDA
jgi:arabinogalactan oligomer/maltooligosaccharide transport system permease protein